MEVNVIKLSARNLDVDIYNYARLQSLNNPLKIFMADDSGDSYYLNKFIAPKRLGAKVEASVMLLKNRWQTCEWPGWLCDKNR